MGKSVIEEILDYSKPSKKVENFLKSRRTYIHCNADRNLTLDQLKSTVAKLETGQIKTHALGNRK